MSKHRSSVISWMTHRYDSQTVPQPLRHAAIGGGLCVSLLLLAAGAILVVSAGIPLFAGSQLTPSSGLHLLIGLGAVASGNALFTLVRSHLDELVD